MDLSAHDACLGGAAQRVQKADSSSGRGAWPLSHPSAGRLLRGLPPAGLRVVAWNSRGLFTGLAGDMAKHRRRIAAVHQLARMHDVLVLSETHSNESRVGFLRWELPGRRIGASHLTDNAGGVALLIGPGLVQSALHLEFFVIALGRVLGCRIVHEGGSWL